MHINKDYKVIESIHGQMIINVHDTGIAHAVDIGEHAKAEIEAIMPYARGVVVDIGANIGTHTLSFAKMAGRVYSFEPQPLCYFNVCANLLINNVQNVTTIQAAVGDFDGVIETWMVDPTQANSTAGIQMGEGNIKVPIRKLDSCNIGPVNFIKIDVEKMEAKVLRGALETLKKYHPVVYCECHMPALVDECIAIMEGLGYKYQALIHYVITWPDGYEMTEDTILNVYGYLFYHQEEAA